MVRALYKQILKALPDFLRRKLKVEGFGIKAEIDAAEQQKAAENPADEKLPEKQALDPSPRLAVNLVEARLRSDLLVIDPAKKRGGAGARLGRCAPEWRP